MKKWKHFDINEYKDLIIKLKTENNYSCVKIKKYLNNIGVTISEQRISLLLKENGFIVGNKLYALTKEQEKEIIELYSFKENGVYALAKRYNVSSTNISKILRKNNITIDSRHSMNARTINEHFFNKIDNQNKAYYLGFIIADGSIVEPKSGNHKSLSIDIHKQDDYLLKKFDKLLGSTGKIHYNSKRPHCFVRYSSTVMWRDLENLGVTPRKTYVAIYPPIEPKYDRHCIRGIFDGDGTVFIRKDETKKHNIRLEFGFAGTYDVLKSIKDTLIRDIGINDNKIIQRKSICQLSFSKLEDIINFYNYIYRDAETFLTRKKEVFEKFLKLYADTEIIN